jgi:hypothetical protein
VGSRMRKHGVRHFFALEMLLQPSVVCNDEWSLNARCELEHAR